MRNFNLIFRAVLVIALVFANALFINAAKGDFGALNTTADGHDGLWCNKVEFTEKDFTLEFWMYIDEQEDKNGSGTNIMSTRHDGNSGFSVSLNVNADNEGSVDVRFFFKTVNQVIYTSWVPREAVSGQWAHIAFIVDSQEKRAMTLLNGELCGDPIEDFDGDWLGNNTNDNGLWIARWWDDPKFYGKLADIRIWNKARTYDEIIENYNQPLKGNEEGLYIYYQFNQFAEVVQNLASPGRNDGTLKSGDKAWNEVFSFEVLSAMPSNLVVADNNVTWTGTADSFEIEVIEKETDEVVETDVVEANTYSLAGLDTTKEYYVKVRALTGVFYSDWASTAQGGSSGLNKTNVDNLSIISLNGSLIINSDAARRVNLFSVDGRVVRNIELIQGINNVHDLAKGIYLIENQKIIVK